MLALVACSPSEGGHVASPPPDATPMHVVQAFVDAVNAQDADLVRDLSLHDSSRFTEWVENGWVLRNATVNQEWTVPYADDPTKTEVFVTFDPSDADSSFERGDTTTWSFLLSHQDQGWVVYDSGAG